MNIKIPHSWLKEYLNTAATPQKIADCLSLCSASVEKIEKVGDDWIYDIEITTNRVDMMSVAGIAREVAAVLPQFGIKARLKKDPYDSKSVSILDRKDFFDPGSGKSEKLTKEKKLKISIKDPQKLCYRVLGVVLDNVHLGLSPKKISQRLEMAGLRSLNNAIDISNYVMTEIGHPTHVFDYDRIKTKKLILRKAKKGETIISLENKKYSLPGGDIVIDDGSSGIIDLPGIIGTANSVVTNETKRVLFFIETNDPVCIRKTSMSLGIRTVAATLNEKGVDPELAKPALLKGIQLFNEIAGAKVASKIIDIYPQPYKAKTLKIPLQLIEEHLGIKLHPNKVIKILNSLGFQTKTSQLPTTNYQLLIKVPSWRANDINIPEDIIEEIARIYGYHNLPSRLPAGQLPEQLPFAKNFYWEEKIKHLLKNWGLTEVYTYSFIGKGLLKKFNQDPEVHLKLKNPLSSDWEYMRTAIIPSLLEVTAQNKAIKENVKIFEIANVYISRKNDLPKEKPQLVIAFKGNKFYKLKGLIESLLEELSIKFKFKQPKDTYKVGKKLLPISSSEVSGEARTPRTVEKAMVKKLVRDWLESKKSLDIFSGDERLGTFGQLKPNLVQKFDISDSIFIAELDFEKIINFASDRKTFHPIPKYPPIIEDLTFEFQSKVLYTKVVSLIKQTSADFSPRHPERQRRIPFKKTYNSHRSLVNKVELVGQYKNKKTFRLYYQHPDKSLTDKEVGKIRKEIVQKLEKEGLNLVGQI